MRSGLNEGGTCVAATWGHAAGGYDLAGSYVLSQGPALLVEGHGHRRATIDIVDDEVPVASFAAARQTVREGGWVEVAVRLSRAPPGIVTLPIEGRGIDASEYTIPPGVTFVPGQRRATFVLAAAADGVPEGEEVLVLAFGDLPAPVVAGSPVRTTVVVRDAELASWQAKLVVGEDSDGRNPGFREGAYGALDPPEFEVGGVRYEVTKLTFEHEDETPLIRVVLAYRADPADHAADEGLRGASALRLRVGIYDVPLNVVRAGEASGQSSSVGARRLSVAPGMPLAVCLRPAWQRCPQPGAVHLKGHRIEADASGLVNVKAGSAYAYRWERSAGGPAGWTDTGGRSKTYVSSFNDYEKLVRARVTYTDTGDTEQTVALAPVAVLGEEDLWGGVLRAWVDLEDGVSRVGYGTAEGSALEDPHFAYDGRFYTVGRLLFGTDSVLELAGAREPGGGWAALRRDLELRVGPHAAALDALAPRSGGTSVALAPLDGELERGDDDWEMKPGTVWPVFLRAVPHVAVRARYADAVAGIEEVEFGFRGGIGGPVQALVANLRRLQVTNFDYVGTFTYVLTEAADDGDPPPSYLHAEVPERGSFDLQAVVVVDELGRETDSAFRTHEKIVSSPTRLLRRPRRLGHRERAARQGLRAGFGEDDDADAGAGGLDRVSRGGVYVRGGRRRRGCAGGAGVQRPRSEPPRQRRRGRRAHHHLLGNGGRLRGGAMRGR